MIEQKHIKIKTMAYHRNGISGEPFVVVTFTDMSDGRQHKREMLATLFPFDAQAIRTAVLDVALLSQGDIIFGSNSWRGDDYDAVLRPHVDAQFGEEGQPF